MRQHFFIVMLVAAVGCGGGGISVEDLPDELEGAQCDRLVACEGIKDRATCEGAFDFDDGDYGTVEAGVKDGTIKYNADKAAECADALGNTDCSFPGFHDDDPCDYIFTGTVATGGACLTDLQCANFGDCAQTSPSCDPDVACCPGMCMGSAAESQIGGPCDDEMHFCAAANSYCKAGSGTGPGTCTALVPTEGAMCDAIDACANPMYCNISFTTGMGTCKKSAASGAACVRTDLIACADSREFCDPTMLKCLSNVDVGAACPTGVRCVGYAECISGTCVGDLAVGAACQVDAGASCAGGLDCIGGVCALPPPGMTCMLP